MSINRDSRDSRDSRNKYSTEKSVKKFCGVCHKAGLPERDYTNHFTKSVPGQQGIVTCPTILNNKCSSCFQLGHFRSACPMQKVSNKRKVEKVEIQPVNQPVNRGGFAILDCDSDIDTESSPPLCGKRKISTITNKPTFADILAREPKPLELGFSGFSGFSVLTKQMKHVKPQPVRAPWAPEFKRVSNWYDSDSDCDSDSDDEEM